MAEVGAEAGEGGGSANLGPDMPPQRAEGGRTTPTDFFDFDVASPEVSYIVCKRICRSTKVVG